MIRKSVRGDDKGEQLNISVPVGIIERFRQRIVGQEEPITEMAKLYMKVKSGIRMGNVGPLDAVFLAGPSGVGKTSSVFALASLLIEDCNNENERELRDPEHDTVLVIEGGSYQYGHEIAKLFGSPPGYLGHRETHPILTQETIDRYKLDHRPNGISLVLVDEMDKAHRAVANAFLNILDQGYITLGDNKTTRFEDTIVFFTTNLGNHEYERQVSGFLRGEKNYAASFHGVYKRDIPPEFRGRIKKTIVFNHLLRPDMDRIIDMQLERIVGKFPKLKLQIHATDIVRDLLIDEGNIDSYGARGIIKTIEAEIFEKLIMLKAINGIKEGDSLIIDLAEGNTIGIFRKDGRSRAFGAANG